MDMKNALLESNLQARFKRQISVASNVFQTMDNDATKIRRLKWASVSNAR